MGDDAEIAAHYRRHERAVFDQLCTFVGSYLSAVYVRVATEELGEQEDLSRKRDTEHAYANVPKDVRKDMEAALSASLKAIGRYAAEQFHSGDQP